MNKSIRIRQAEESDSLNLCMLKIQVWLHTYATEGIRSEFSEYLSEEFTREKMRKMLMDKDKITLVAEQEGHLLACVELDWKSYNSNCDGNAPELTVLYVSEHFHGQGVGFQLLSEMERLVREAGCAGLWLTVFHENVRAIAFYERQDYKCVGKTYFSMGENQYENWIMYKEFGE
jgi:ribosomal protein S18 acetylase RimI-like enzyme